MDFIDALRNFGTRATKMKDVVATEEATKASLVMPFFQLLGYDIFNPMEFVPEFTADVGVKKGEKVDYAIVIDDEPVILIECKKYGETLSKHSTQLFRYFSTTPAKFAILTNGVTYKFYTDLNEANKMDLEPFLLINILEIHEHLVPELKRFTKDGLDVEAAYLAAVELKYTNRIKEFLNTIRSEPTEEFVKYMMSEVFDGQRSQKNIKMFGPLIKQAFSQYISDNIRETLKNAMASQDAPKAQAQESKAAAVEDEEVDEQVLTEDELEAFKIVKAVLRVICDVDRLTTRHAQNYVAILLDDNRNKRICRLWFKGRKKHITIPDEQGKPVRYDIENLNDIYAHAELLKEVCNRRMFGAGSPENDDNKE